MVIKKLVIWLTRAYFTAATIMDGDLGMPVMFSLLILFAIPRVQEFFKKVIKPQQMRLLTPLRFVVYYRRRLHELSEYLLTILTLGANPDAVRSALCVHQVSYSYITPSVGAKVNSKIAYYARNRVSGNKGIETKQHNYPLATSYESHGKTHTLVGGWCHQTLRTDATLGRGVSEGTMKRGNQFKGQRRYLSRFSSGNRGSKHDEFFGDHVAELD